MSASPVAARWHLSDRFDPAVVPIADRHYNRRAHGSPQFVPPGRCVVLRTEQADAYWITSWPFAEYVRHAWPGAWVCSAFRNESPHLSSSLILEAVSITRRIWEPPALPYPLVTFVNPGKVRHKRDPGRCFLRAGFVRIGWTKGHLLALGMPLDAMPEAAEPIGWQLSAEWSAFTTDDLWSSPNPDSPGGVSARSRLPNLLLRRRAGVCP